MLSRATHRSAGLSDVDPTQVQDPHEYGSEHQCPNAPMVSTIVTHTRCSDMNRPGFGGGSISGQPARGQAAPGLILRVCSYHQRSLRRSSAR